MELKELYNKTLAIFQIDSAESLPKALMDALLEADTKKLDDFVNVVGDLSVDWLQKIFQYYLADRKEKMQDYTPASLAKFVGKLVDTPEEKTVFDLCAGSGALTIQKWNLNRNLKFICYEYDEKVIPLLLFNLAIRNMDAVVINGDALTEEEFARYTVTSGEKYSTVTESGTATLYSTPNSCVSNPPYNIKWKHPPFAQIQSRFCDCALPPEENANYAFILTALSRCERKAALILPNRILTPGNSKERQICAYLVEKNLIEAVISCPDSMFEGTGIPVCILVLNKKKITTTISFLDMRQTFLEEVREQNGQFGGASHEKRTYKKRVKVFSEEGMQKAINAIQEKVSEAGFSKPVSSQIVKENDNILNPGEYIEMQEAESKHRECGEIIDDLNRIIKEKNAVKLTMNESLAKSLGMYEVFQLFKHSEETCRAIEEVLSFTEKKIEKENFISMTKNAKELKFENGSKETVSTILLSILQMWKQHIMYLNNEENRYLAELRDALLPDLMSGKLSL